MMHTAGNRMLEHYMRKEGMLEENTKVKVSTAMATRLGAVPTLGKVPQCHLPY